MKYKIILTMLFVLLISGCSVPSEVFQERIDLAEKDKGDIVIGVGWDFRDDLFEEGIDMAVEEINASGGILDSPLQLIKTDDKSSVTHGLSVAQSFANNLDMVAVIGHRKSAISIPAAAIYENAGLLMLTPASTAPKLTNLGYKLIFSSIPNDEQIGEQMASHAVSSGYRKIAIFYKDDEYGRGLANAFEDSAIANGIEIIDRVSSYSDVNDLKRKADMWITLGVDAIFLAEDMPVGAEAIAEFRQVGMNVPIMGGNALDSADLAKISGNHAEGTVIASVFNPNDTSEKTVKFVKMFTERYQVTPNNYAAQGYDAVYLLANAIQAAGTRVPADIANELKEMQNWAGVTGNHLFDSTGSVQNKPIVKKILRDNHFDYLDKEGK